MPRSMAKVVVLDDDRVMVELLRTVIEDEGHQAVSAVEMDDVPACVRADLVVSDLMPLTSYRAGVARQWLRDLHDRFGVRVAVVTARKAALADPDRLGADAVIADAFAVGSVA